jgi:hypothetical protein
MATTYLGTSRRRRRRDFCQIQEACEGWQLANPKQKEQLLGSLKKLRTTSSIRELLLASNDVSSIRHGLESLILLQNADKSKSNRIFHCLRGTMMSMRLIVPINRKRHPFLHIPTHVGRTVIDFCASNDMCNVERVCKRWKFLARQQVGWSHVSVGVLLSTISTDVRSWYAKNRNISNTKSFAVGNRESRSYLKTPLLQVVKLFHFHRLTRLCLENLRFSLQDMTSVQHRLTHLSIHRCRIKSKTKLYWDQQSDLLKFGNLEQLRFTFNNVLFPFHRVHYFARLQDLQVDKRCSQKLEKLLDDKTLEEIRSSPSLLQIVRMEATHQSKDLIWIPSAVTHLHLQPLWYDRENFPVTRYPQIIVLDVQLCYTQYDVLTLFPNLTNLSVGAVATSYFYPFFNVLPTVSRMLKLRQFRLYLGRRCRSIFQYMFDTKCELESYHNTLIQHPSLEVLEFSTLFLSDRTVTQNMQLTIDRSTNVITSKIIDKIQPFI